MISTSVKLSGRVSIKALQVDTEAYFGNDMVRLGEFAIKTIRARVARGIGSDDTAMKPLNSNQHPFKSRGRTIRYPGGYPQWKSAHGLQPIRDLAGTGKDGGHMLDNLTVRSVTESSVRMAITARKARDKAISNERRTPWLSFSDADERAIVAYAAKLFRSAIEIVRRRGLLAKAA